MTKQFFWALYGALFILLIALGVISILLRFNQKGLYLDLMIALLIILSAVVVVFLITINRKINVPIRMLQDSTHRLATDLSKLTEMATGIGNGDLSKTAKIQTQPLEIKTRGELGNLAQDVNQMIVQLQEQGPPTQK